MVWGSVEREGRVGGGLAVIAGRWRNGLGCSEVKIVEVQRGGFVAENPDGADGRIVGWERADVLEGDDPVEVEVPAAGRVVPQDGHADPIFRLAVGGEREALAGGDPGALCVGGGVEDADFTRRVRAGDAANETSAPSKSRNSASTSVAGGRIQKSRKRVGDAARVRD